MVNMFVKKRIIFLLIVTVILSGVGILSNNNIHVYADSNTVYVEELDISNYVNCTPKPADSKHKDWLFAGWYEDKQCEKYVLNKEKATGGKYAKFVPNDVLSVKCQVKEGTNVSTETTMMRLVSTVDSLSYKEVGFEITVGNKTIVEIGKSVYKKIVASNDGVKFEYTPEEFSDASKYFSTVTLVNIPKSGFDKGIIIKPFWVTVDGSKVYGVNRIARVEDSYLNVINVPVRLYTDKKVAAGFAKVTYDTNSLEYIGNDNGTVFDNVDTNEDNHSILCVGDIDDISNNVDADGIFVNLRFKAKTSIASNLLFEVKDEQFCDISEEFVFTDPDKSQFDISDVVYKVIRKE